uniref:Uncharacterized protein n=1 Tax=Triticum urartu TaxID=4572 RepID=A0A8R7QLN3_TRIUA
MAATAYERRLLAAADLVLSADGKSQLPRLSSTDLGVTADLKPHQLDGVDWLIRRYHLGVNVLLGPHPLLLLLPRCPTSPLPPPLPLSFSLSTTPSRLTNRVPFVLQAMR